MTSYTEDEEEEEEDDYNLGRRGLQLATSVDCIRITYQITYQTRPPQGKLAQPQESHRLK